MVIEINGVRYGLRGEGPFIARSASDKTDDWPFWYVSGPDGRRNVLYSPDQAGAVLTDKATAFAIVEVSKDDIKIYNIEQARANN